MLLHGGVFQLDRDSQLNSPWHRLLPQSRWLCTLLLVFAIALTPPGRWYTWAIYGAFILCIATLSRITWIALLRRIAVEFVFVGLVLLGTLFQQGGEVVWAWGWLRITSEGLLVLGSVTLKVLLSLAMVNLLVLTTSVADLLQGLLMLRTPPLLVAILASMYRYIGVLVGEFNQMRQAALSRNLLGNPKWHRLVIGNMMGSLFIRTYDRGDRIHQAMLARGYQGVPSRPATPEQRRSWDVWAISLTAGIALLGQGLYLWPR